MAKDDFLTEAADPTASVSRLMELAKRYPQTHGLIAENPAASPELLDWLESIADADTVAAIAKRRSPSGDSQPSRQPLPFETGNWTPIGGEQSSVSSPLSKGGIVPAPLSSSTLGDLGSAGSSSQIFTPQAQEPSQAPPHQRPAKATAPAPARKSRKQSAAGQSSSGSAAPRTAEQQAPRAQYKPRQKAQKKSIWESGAAFGLIITLIVAGIVTAVIASSLNGSDPTPPRPTSSTGVQYPVQPPISSNPLTPDSLMPLFPVQQLSQNQQELWNLDAPQGLRVWKYYTLAENQTLLMLSPTGDITAQHLLMVDTDTGERLWSTPIPYYLRHDLVDLAAPDGLFYEYIVHEHHSTTVLNRTAYFDLTVIGNGSILLAVNLDDGSLQYVQNVREYAFSADTVVIETRDGEILAYAPGDFSIPVWGILDGSAGSISGAAHGYLYLHDSILSMATGEEVTFDRDLPMREIYRVYPAQHYLLAKEWDYLSMFEPETGVRMWSSELHRRGQPLLTTPEYVVTHEYGASQGDPDWMFFLDLRTGEEVLALSDYREISYHETAVGNFFALMVPDRSRYDIYDAETLTKLDEIHGERFEHIATDGESTLYLIHREELLLAYDLAALQELWTHEFTDWGFYTFMGGRVVDEGWVDRPLIGFN